MSPREFSPFPYLRYAYPAMSAMVPQPPVPTFLEDDYIEAALETAAGLKKISKFATRLEEWFDLWSEHIIMPPLGVMQQAASLISRMTSVRKTLVQALNALDPMDFDQSPNSPDSHAASPTSSEEPQQAPTPSSPSSDSLLNEALRLSNELYAEARLLAKASALPPPPPPALNPDLDLDLDLDPDPDPTPPPLHPSVPSTPNLTIPVVRTCPTIPLAQLPAATAVLEDKLQRLIASSIAHEEFCKLPEGEAAELLEHIKKTRGSEWMPEFLSTPISSLENFPTISASPPPPT